eukprot:414334-Pelagomonas_calceolata.AAC.3
MPVAYVASPLLLLCAGFTPADAAATPAAPPAARGDLQKKAANGLQKQLQHGLSGTCTDVG